MNVARSSTEDENLAEAFHAPALLRSRSDAARRIRERAQRIQRRRRVAVAGGLGALVLAGAVAVPHVAANHLAGRVVIPSAAGLTPGSPGAVPRSSPDSLGSGSTGPVRLRAGLRVTVTSCPSPVGTGSCQPVRMVMPVQQLANLELRGTPRGYSVLVRMPLKQRQQLASIARGNDRSTFVVELSGKPLARPGPEQVGDDILLLQSAPATSVRPLLRALGVTLPLPLPLPARPGPAQSSSGQSPSGQSPPGQPGR